MQFFKHLFQSSQTLSSSDFEKMCQNAEILEQDERGIKVVRLPSGDILKVFRVKRLISGTNIYSYARRFCRNATRLSKLAIPTVNVKALYHFESSHNTAVLYSPLAGKTIRQLIHEDAIRPNLAENLGRFLASLHSKGVHFHSLHTGNVVQMPDGNLGLIDISDMSVYAWPLFCNTRIRSFKRWCKYQDDMNALGKKFWASLQASYFSESHLSQACIQKIKQANSQLIAWRS
jgi:tRNA A-37 threonylcarbamoyl transferase component Bud32